MSQLDPVTAPLIAIDWGTTSLRGALLSPGGQVLEQRAFPQGILSVPPGGFTAVFNAAFGDWARQPQALTLICGMAGSRQGWLEAPYVACPAGFDDLRSKISWIPGLHWRVGIVPGLQHIHHGVPDVMRGEETQIFGALAQNELTHGTLVLPGTHSKWAHVHNGQVSDFSTWMTGEFYALLSQHSILARSLSPHAALEPNSFQRGVEQALRGPNLLHTAFGTRALDLFGQMGPDALPSYLSGLVIGEELKAQTFNPEQTVHIVGGPSLTERYTLALRLLGQPICCHGAEATWAGLWALARELTR
jgi:2-dehydro-3-deoxygalactonokinase